LIVDSSAVLAILLHENDGESLLAAIAGAGVVGIGAPTAVETGLVLTARLQRDATGVLLRFFEETGIQIIPFTTIHWQRAVEAYARFGKGRHPAALNFGDCMTYATASLARQPLLCRGDDFRKTDLELV
jgi:ribonuclease VapC